MDLLEVADKLWRGELDVAGPPGPEGPDDETAVNPFLPRGELARVGPGTAFVSSFANVTALDTGAGLVLFDTGSPMTAAGGPRPGPRLARAPLDTAVFTHGHIDHAMGMGPFDDEAAKAGAPRPRVVAHEAVPARFARYRLTAGWNQAINTRQFRLPGLRWPTVFREPDETYRDART